MTSRTSLIISGSSAEVGSSNSMATGSIANARAMATRCCWPPERWASGIFDAWSARPTRSRRRVRPWRLLPRRCGRGPCVWAMAMLLQDGQMRKQLEILEDHANALPRSFGRSVALRTDLDVAHRDPAGIVGLEAVDALDQRRLAGAGRAADHHHLATSRSRVEQFVEHLERCRRIFETWSSVIIAVFPARSVPGGRRWYPDRSGSMPSDQVSAVSLCHRRRQSIAIRR